MDHAFCILAATPHWVMLLFGYLVWQGIVSLRDRTVPIWRVLVVPAMFVALGFLRLVLLQHNGILPLLVWIAGAIPLSLIGFVTSPLPRGEAMSGRRVIRRGSFIPLVRNVSFFSLQYCATVSSALEPGGTIIAFAGHAVSGATAGYFLGWAVAFLFHLNRADRAANHPG